MPNNKRNKTSNSSGKRGNGPSRFRNASRSEGMAQDNITGISSKDYRKGSGSSTSRGSIGSGSIYYPNSNSNLVTNSSNLQYSWPTGNIIRDTHVGPVKEDWGASVPGFIQFNYVPAYGSASSRHDPLNVAAVNLFEYVMHANSRTGVPYDANDLMMTNIIVDSISQLMTLGIRVYGLINYFNFENRYAPYDMFAAMGFDYQDWMLNQANFRTQYDTLVYEFNQSIKAPANFAFFKRHTSLCANVYQGKDNQWAQMYWFMPTGWYNYTKDEDGRPVLKFVTFDEARGSELMTVDMFIGLIRDLIHVIIDDSNFQQMGADVFKAFGEGGLVRMDFVPTAYTVKPIVGDTAALEMMQNFVTYDWGSDHTGLTLTSGPDFNIYQDSDVKMLISNVRYAVTAQNPQIMQAVKDYYTRSQIITTEGSGTPEATMRNTSFVAIPRVVSTSSPTETVFELVYGSEIPISITWAFNKPNGTTRLSTIAQICVAKSMSTDFIIGFLQNLSILNAFKFRPKCAARMLIDAPDDSNWADGEYITSDNFDVDVYAVVNAEELRRIHYVRIIASCELMS